MEEHLVIAYTALHLIDKQKAKITKISARTKRNLGAIKGILSKNGISEEIVDGIQFKCQKEDIVATRWKKEKKGGGIKLVIEAKGGSVSKSNKLYTALGQFICLKESLSTSNWFAFALPYSWREQVRKMLRDSNGKAKPIIDDIINIYAPSPKYYGLYFYFVKDNRKVIPETWRETLK